MNHLRLIRLVVLKRPDFQSRKYGMPNENESRKAENGIEKHWHMSPLNLLVRLRCRCRLTDKLSVLSEPRHARRSRSYYLVAETSSVSSVFIARGYLSSNVQDRHPFHHLPLDAGVA